eukprot:3437949-Rhodomonas_salina.1
MGVVQCGVWCAVNAHTWQRTRTRARAMLRERAGVASSTACWSSTKMLIRANVSSVGLMIDVAL